MPGLCAKLTALIFPMFLLTATAVSASPEPVSDSDLKQFTAYVAKAGRCMDEEEYLCAAYNYSLAEGTGISFRDEENERALKIDYATSLYLLDKQVLLGKVDEKDELAVEMVEHLNRFTFSTEENLTKARLLLEEAGYLSSYFYIAVTLDLVNELGHCNATSFEALADVFEILRPGELLSDFDEYDPVVDEATREAAFALGFRAVRCVF